MFLIILSLIVALGLSVAAFNAKNCIDRGTNKFTRFIRNTAGNNQLRNVVFASFGAMLFFAIVGLFVSKVWVCLFQVIPIIVSIVFQHRDTHKNENRVGDARYMTKVATEAAPAAGVVAGTAVAAVATGGASLAVQAGAAAAAAAVGKSAGKIAKHAGDQMKDQEDHGFEAPTMELAENIVKVINNWKVDKKALLGEAKHLGIDTKGDYSAVLNKIIEEAPPAVLKTLHPALSKEQKAAAIVMQDKTPHEAYVIDAEYREVN